MQERPQSGEGHELPSRSPGLASHHSDASSHHSDASSHHSDVSSHHSDASSHHSDASSHHSDASSHHSGGSRSGPLLGARRPEDSAPLSATLHRGPAIHTPDPHTSGYGADPFGAHGQPLLPDGRLTFGSGLGATLPPAGHSAAIPAKIFNLGIS